MCRWNGKPWRFSHLTAAMHCTKTRHLGGNHKTLQDAEAGAQGSILPYAVSLLTKICRVCSGGVALKEP